MRGLVLGTLILTLGVAGCTRPEGYETPATWQTVDSTDYRVEDRPGGGFTMIVRFAQYQFIPETAAVEERCRRDALAFAHDEAERRGMRGARIEQQRMRSSAGRNGIVGITSCTASVPVLPAT